MSDTLQFRARCPRCGEEHDVRVEITARQPGPNHWVREGSEFTLQEDLESAGYVRVRPPEPSEDVRILEDGITCGADALWTVMTIRSARLERAELVALDLEVLARVHWLTPSRHGFWRWANQLLEPGAWAERLYTSDPVRRLRQQLALRAPLPARKPLEARLFVAMLNCSPVGSMSAIHRDGRELWVQPCAFEPAAAVADFELTFEIEDPREETGVIEIPGGPSKILSAETFRELALELVSSAPAYPDDVEPSAMPEAHQQVLESLGQALVYLDQVVSYIPADECAVPIDAFWGDATREEREANPERYQRAYLLAMRAAFREHLDHLGRRRVFDARSAVEMAAFMELHRCPRCAAPTPRIAGRTEAQGDELHVLYAGVCPSCLLNREFRFRIISDEEPVDNGGEALQFGEGTSRCLDPAQLLVVATQLARRDRETDPYRVRMAIGAIDQAMAFLPPGVNRPEPHMMRSLLGWLVFDAEPGRLTRSSLEQERDRLRSMLARSGA